MVRGLLDEQAIAADKVAATKMVAVHPRLDSVDLLRGVVMVLMALDHTRGFFSNVAFDPTDLQKTTAALFLTRWITHFCAPVFVFLAGTGAYLSGARGKPTPQLAWFLLTRGSWLVLLELTLVRFTWFFNVDYGFVLCAVIWAIGWSMVVLAGLVFLPTAVITLVGITLLAGHNLLDGLAPDRFGSWSWLWKILHSGGGIEPVAGVLVIAAYPLLPWLSVMAAGYGFGALLLLSSEQRRRWLWLLGSALCVAFVALRATNWYGDPRPWSEQPNGWFTLFSFLNCHKYPPSLLFVLMTLGPALIGLAVLDRGPSRVGSPLVVFGRVPLFYYVLHFALIHTAAVVFAYARYGEASWLFQNPNVPNSRPADYGYDLAVVYLVWINVVLLLYPACRWFAEVKRRNRNAWLSYL